MNDHACAGRDCEFFRCSILQFKFNDFTTFKTASGDRGQCRCMVNIHAEFTAGRLDYIHCGTIISNTEFPAVIDISSADLSAGQNGLHTALVQFLTVYRITAADFEFKIGQVGQAGNRCTGNGIIHSHVRTVTGDICAHCSRNDCAFCCDDIACRTAGCNDKFLSGVNHKVGCNTVAVCKCAVFILTGDERFCITFADCQINEPVAIQGNAGCGTACGYIQVCPFFDGNIIDGCSIFYCDFAVFFDFSGSCRGRSMECNFTVFADSQSRYCAFCKNVCLSCDMQIGNGTGKTAVCDCFNDCFIRASLHKIKEFTAGCDCYIASCCMIFKTNRSAILDRNIRSNRTALNVGGTVHNCYVIRFRSFCKEQCAVMNGNIFQRCTGSGIHGTSKCHIGNCTFYGISDYLGNGCSIFAHVREIIQFCTIVQSDFGSTCIGVDGHCSAGTQNGFCYCRTR